MQVVICDVKCYDVKFAELAKLCVASVDFCVSVLCFVYFIFESQQQQLVMILQCCGVQASNEVLGACLVTQPRKLVDKKSSFLRALRRETSDQPNTQSTMTSSPLPVTTDSTNKQV